jgi:hypothetical protein
MESLCVLGVVRFGSGVALVARSVVVGPRSVGTQWTVCAVGSAITARPRSSRSEQTSTARIESVPLREALRSRCQGRTCPLSSTGQKPFGGAWLAVTATGVTDSGVRVLLCRWAARGFEGTDRLVDRDGEPKVAMLRARVRPTR